MLQKIGKKISINRHDSAKHLAELQKRHTEGDLSGVQPRARKNESRKRLESAKSSIEVNVEQKITEKKRAHSQSPPM